MICRQCGNTVPDISKFCVACGASLGYPSTNPPPSGYNRPPGGGNPLPESGYNPTSPWGSPPPVSGSNQSPYENNPPSNTPSFLNQSYEDAQMPIASQQGVYRPVPNPTSQPSLGKLSKTGKIMGIVVGCICLVGLIPCLGWLNWFTLLFGLITKVLCWVAVFTEGQQDAQARNNAVVGLVIATIALFVGLIRLILGAGCL